MGNPFDALSFGVKLALAALALAVVVGALAWVRSVLDDRTTVREIKATARVLERANKLADAAAEKRAAARARAEASITQQMEQLNERADDALRAELERPLHPERVRLVNCALRGPEREGGCEPVAVR